MTFINKYRYHKLYIRRIYRLNILTVINSYINSVY